MSQNLARASAVFGYDIYQNAVKERPNDNLILSPLSIQMACTLAYMGAGGRTAEVMAKGLNLPTGDRSVIAGEFQNILSTYKNHPMLTIANKIYVAGGYQVKKEFRDLAVKSFNSDAESIDFQNPENAAQTINSWVEGKTNNKIHNLINPSSLDAYTRMILVNAIHFKGNWACAFPKKHTTKAAFYVNETSTVQVDMMEVKSNFKYADIPDLDAAAIELPYQNSNLSMLIILPNSRTGLRDLESRLGKMNILDVTKQLYSTDVLVKLPRFKIELDIELNDILKRMGMEEMFSPSADFSNLLESSEPLAVSKVVHKAFIEVNEEGTEAAASTGKPDSPKEYHDGRRVFICNKPFYIGIIDVKSQPQLIFEAKFARGYNLYEPIATYTLAQSKVTTPYQRRVPTPRLPQDIKYKKPQFPNSDGEIEYETSRNNYDLNFSEPNRGLVETTHNKKQQPCNNQQPTDLKSNDCQNKPSGSGNKMPSAQKQKCCPQTDPPQFSCGHKNEVNPIFIICVPTIYPQSVPVRNYDPRYEQAEDFWCNIPCNSTQPRCREIYYPRCRHSSCPPIYNHCNCKHALCCRKADEQQQNYLSFIHPRENQCKYNFNNVAPPKYDQHCKHVHNSQMRSNDWHEPYCCCQCCDYCEESYIKSIEDCSCILPSAYEYAHNYEYVPNNINEQKCDQCNKHKPDNYSMQSNKSEISEKYIRTYFPQFVSAQDETITKFNDATNSHRSAINNLIYKNLRFIYPKNEISEPPNGNTYSRRYHDEEIYHPTNTFDQNRTKKQAIFSNYPSISIPPSHILNSETPTKFNQTHPFHNDATFSIIEDAPDSTIIPSDDTNINYGQSSNVEYMYSKSCDSANGEVPLMYDGIYDPQFVVTQNNGYGSTSDPRPIQTRNHNSIYGPATTTRSLPNWSNPKFRVNTETYYNQSYDQNLVPLSVPNVLIHNNQTDSTGAVAPDIPYLRSCNESFWYGQTYDNMIPPTYRETYNAQSQPTGNEKLYDPQIALSCNESVSLSDDPKCSQALDSNVPSVNSHNSHQFICIHNNQPRYEEINDIQVGSSHHDSLNLMCRQKSADLRYKEALESPPISPHNNEINARNEDARNSMTVPIYVEKKQLKYEQVSDLRSQTSYNDDSTSEQRSYTCSVPTSPYMPTPDSYSNATSSFNSKDEKKPELQSVRSSNAISIKEIWENAADTQDKPTTTRDDSPYFIDPIVVIIDDDDD